MTEGPADFGGLLRRLRDRAGLTQEELAASARVGVNTVSELERGRHQWCHKQTAQRLATALGLTGRAGDLFLAAARGLGPGADVQLAPFGQPGLSPLEVRYSLPPEAAAFTGRDSELDRITAAVTGAADVGAVVAIHAIDGMPGVGKTALAVHAAHRLRDRFPDRQLFIDLHGHTPGHDPAPAGVALAGLLAAVGVDARSLPADVQDRAALWRDRLAGQRVLLVLDNAASSSQVSPLLPGSDGCLVLVTSRRHLGDLPGTAIGVGLEVLSPEHAREMFVRLASRASADPIEAVDELVGMAGFLPLAISLLARVYARHPSWTLADLIAETRASMLTLAAENNSVAAAFEVSYRHLPADQQRFFRRLGLHPGTTIETFAAAALAGISPAEAAELLDALHREALLTEARYRRYRLHDLIRRFAQDRAVADPASEREQAMAWLLDFYTRTAAAAGSQLARQSRASPLPAQTPFPAALPDLPDSTLALAWARAERVNLLACLDQAAETGQPTWVVALTSALAALLQHDGPWADAISRHTAAVQAARQLGDQRGWADALHDLGVVQRLADDYPGAAQALQEALSIYRDLGDRLGQANALCYLGAVEALTGQFAGPAQALQEALSIYRDLGDRIGQANALNYLGDLQGRMTGDYPGAAQALQEALSIYRDLGDRIGQANVLNFLGVVRRMTGDYPGAAQALQEALDTSRDLGHRIGQANALHFLGVVRRMTGDYPGAAQALHEALSIYSDLGDRGGEAEALNEAGTLDRARGLLSQAAAHYQQALDLARAIDSSWDEAHALAGLGRCAQTAHRTADAQALLQQAQQIFDQIGAAEAAGIAAELHALTQQGA